jgi:hypothetical protein
MSLSSSASSVESGMPAPAVRRRIRWLGALVGAWAILTGFAVFVLLQGEFGSAAALPRTAVRTFLLGLFVAALVSLVAEYLHDRIKEGAAAAPLTVPRVLVLMLLLSMFEIFASAGYEVVRYLAPSPHHGQSATVRIRQAVEPGIGGGGAATPDPVPSVGPLAELALLGTLWAVVAAVLGLRLTRIVLAGLPGDLRSVWRGARQGSFAGFLVAPAVVVGYTLAVRLAVHLHALTLGPRGSRPGALLVLAVLAVLVAAGWAWRRGRIRTAALCLGLVLVYAMATLDQERERLWTMGVLAALVWGVPALVLGALAPLLRARADEPRLWGLLATGTALLLGALTWWKLENPVFYWVAVGVALIGLFFLVRPRASLRDYWPLFAIAMAAMVSSLMFLAQYATFLGVLVQFHAVHALPGLRPIRSMGSGPRSPRSRTSRRSIWTRSSGIWSARRATSRGCHATASWTGCPRSGRRSSTSTTASGASASPSIAPRGCGGSPDLPRWSTRCTRRSPRPSRCGTGRSSSSPCSRGRTSSSTTRRRAAPPAGGSALQRQLRALDEREAHGPDVRQLETDLWQFAQLPPHQRGHDGPCLLCRVDSLLSAAGYRVESRNLPLPRPSPFDPPGARRVTRLLELREQILRETSAPGSVALTPPRPPAGAPAVRPISPDLKLPDPLEEYEQLRAAVAQELRIALQQEPPGAPVRVDPASIGVRVTFPAAARLGTLDRARVQLTRARDQAQHLQEWLEGPSARLLELALVGAFGFWMTVGRLAAWRIAFPPEPAPGD